MAPQSREQLRAQWGIDNNTVLVALLADRPECIDAGSSALAIAFAFEALAAAQAARGDVRLLCHPLCRRRLDAAVLAELLHQPQLLMQDARVLAPWRVLGGCDLTVAPDPLNAGLSILWANALGLPVITPPEPRLPLLPELEHRVEARSRAAKHLAKPLTDWVRAHQPAAAM